MANDELVSPLTESHLTQINAGLEKLRQAKAAIELAERAGVPVTEQKQQAQEAETKLRQLKSVYFPGR